MKDAVSFAEMNHDDQMSEILALAAQVPDPNGQPLFPLPFPPPLITWIEEKLQLQDQIRRLQMERDYWRTTNTGLVRLLRDEINSLTEQLQAMEKNRDSIYEDAKKMSQELEILRAECAFGRSFALQLPQLIMGELGTLELPPANALGTEAFEITAPDSEGGPEEPPDNKLSPVQTPSSIRTIESSPELLDENDTFTDEARTMTSSPVSLLEELSLEDPGITAHDNKVQEEPQIVAQPIKVEMEDVQMSGSSAVPHKTPPRPSPASKSGWVNPTSAATSTIKIRVGRRLHNARSQTILSESVREPSIDPGNSWKLYHDALVTALGNVYDKRGNQIWCRLCERKGITVTLEGTLIKPLYPSDGNVGLLISHYRDKHPIVFNKISAIVENAFSVRG